MGCCPLRSWRLGYGISILALVAMFACGRTRLSSTAGASTPERPDSGLRDAEIAGKWGGARDGAAMAEGGSAGTETSGLTQISAGTEYACGLRADGSVTCWGDNSYGQAVPPVETFTQISAGWYHTCGLQPDGSAT